jgi:hypothetical protein
MKNPQSDLVWQKSSLSGPNGGPCVEMAKAPDGVYVRDSKDPSGPVLRFTRSEVEAWLGGAKAGEFDHMI